MSAFFFHAQRRGKCRELRLRFHAAQVLQFLTVLVGLFLFALHHNQRLAFPRIARFQLRLGNGRRARGRHQGEAAAFAHEQGAFLFLDVHLGRCCLFFPLVVREIHAVDQDAEQKKSGQQYGIQRPAAHAGHADLFHRLQAVGGFVVHGSPLL